MDSSQASKILSHCPMCKKVYGKDAVRHLGEQQGAGLYHCTCHSCGQAMIAVVLEQMGLVSSIGMMTDLEVADALRFYEAEAVSKDECVAIHRVLDAQSWEFCQSLLKK